MRLWALLVVALLLASAACDDDDPDAGSPTDTAAPTPTITATQTATPSATAPPIDTATPAPPPDDFSRGTPLGRQTGGATCDFLFPDVEGLEVGQIVDDVFVCIALPKPGASVGDSLEVRDFEAGAFEQHVVIELRLASGTVVARTFAVANAPDVGLVVGEWTATLSLPTGATFDTATLAAFAESARDGSIDFGGAVTVGGHP